MKVRIFNGEANHDQIREFGFAYVNLATLMKRAEIQVAQAKANPNHKELAEARASIARVKDGVAFVNAVAATLKK